MEEQGRERQLDSVLCPHCGIYLNKKTYQAHKRLYFDKNSKMWVKKRRVSYEVNEFDIGESDDSIEGEHQWEESVQGDTSQPSIEFISDDDFILSDSGK